MLYMKQRLRKYGIVCICSDLRKVKVKVTLEKDNTKLAFFAHVIIDLAII